MHIGQIRGLVTTIVVDLCAVSTEVWINIAIGLGAGVVASLLASVALFLRLYKLRPNIKISPEIARTPMRDETAFRIKLVNKSRFAAVDLGIAVYRKKTRNVTGGQVFGTKQLSTRHASVPVLAAFDRRDKDAQYALRIRIIDDVDKEWADDEVEFLQIRVVARHGLSGAFGEFHKEYMKRTAIKDGNSHFGDDFNIS